MKNWYIEDRDNEIFILYGDNFSIKKKIYPDEEQKANIDFYLLYSEDYKLVGYQLSYNYVEKVPKFVTYNSFGIIYNKRKSQFTTNFEVIFEDATIRLLTFIHTPINVQDYFLVGRWRNPSVKEEIVNL